MLLWAFIPDYKPSQVETFWECIDDWCQNWETLTPTLRHFNLQPETRSITKTDISNFLSVTIIVSCVVCAAALSQYRIKQNYSPQLQISPDPISVSSLSLSTGPGCTTPPPVVLLVLVACIAFFINLLHAQSNELEHKPSLCVWWSSIHNTKSGIVCR